MSYVSDVSIAEYLYRKEGESFSRIKEDAPEWAKREYDKRMSAGVWDLNNPVKVE